MEKQLDDDECEHEWEFVDASFDHEFGTRELFYDRCTVCGETKEHDSDDDRPDNE